MAHFAKVENGIVTQVIVIEPEVLAAGVVGDPSQWVQTSYNNNIRNVYAGIGYIYDSVRDIFYAPQPYPSWTLQPFNIMGLNANNDIAVIKTELRWQAPVVMPNDKKEYKWDETTLSWSEVIKPTK